MEYKNNMVMDYVGHLTSKSAHYLKKIYARIGAYVHTPYAVPLLSILFYFEAICLLPVDPILFIYCIERKQYALWYALVATISSVLGGVTSYYIGSYVWHAYGSDIIHNSLINCLATPAHLTSLMQHYQHNGFLTILLVGLTPFPFKAITLSAGFCRLSLIPFVICSCIVRGVRFFGYAWGLAWLSQRYKHYSKRNLVVICATIFFLFCIAWLTIRYSIIRTTVS